MQDVLYAHTREVRSVRIHVPLQHLHNQDAPGELLLRTIREKGTDRLEVHMRTDFDADRPPFWSAMKQKLSERGFTIERDPDTGDDEWFFPATFFSADVAFSAAKTYNSNRSKEMGTDIKALLDCSPAAESTTGAGRSHLRQAERASQEPLKLVAY